MDDDQIQPQPRRRRRERDDDEERPRRRRRRDYDDEDDDEVDSRIRRDPVEGFIPYRNPKALIAYYLGVFSLIPCAGLFLGPAALVLGILGMRFHKQHKSAGGVGHAIAGIVLGTLTTLAHLGLVVIIVIGILSS
jgi:hypothetical protein